MISSNDYSLILRRRMLRDAIFYNHHDSRYYTKYVYVDNTKEVIISHY